MLITPEVTCASRSGEKRHKFSKPRLTEVCLRQLFCSGSYSLVASPSGSVKMSRFRVWLIAVFVFDSFLDPQSSLLRFSLFLAGSSRSSSRRDFRHGFPVFLLLDDVSFLPMMMLFGSRNNIYGVPEECPLSTATVRL